MHPQTAPKQNASSTILMVAKAIRYHINIFSPTTTSCILFTHLHIYKKLTTNDSNILGILNK